MTAALTTEAGLATDPVGTVRVHPDHDPADPHARRYVRTDTVHDLGITDPAPWVLLSGHGFLFAAGAYVDDWPVQSWTELAGVLGHHPASDRSAR